MPLMTRRRWRNDGNAVGVVSQNLFPTPPSSSYDGNVGGYPLFEFYSSGLTGPIHTEGCRVHPIPFTLWGVICYSGITLKRTSGLQFHLVYSSEFTGPLYFDVTESPSRHCQ